MKLHHIEIQNIASLKGKHTIDFDFLSKESNLFAITGATGSGKSTILNSISLALFGEVYKKSSHSYDFVTLGEDFGQIDLTFSVNQIAYLAHWKLRTRKKNGENLKKPQLTRLLFKLQNNEKIPLEIPIEEITQLNFDQFCKTTILNQGQFSKFLTSSFIERKEILEKFYHGENLKGLSELLKEKVRKANSKIEETKNYISGLEDYSEEENIDEINLILKKTSQEAQDIEKIHRPLEKTLTSLKDIKNQFGQLQTTKKKKKQILESLKILTDEYNLNIKKLHSLEDENKKFTLTFNHKKPLLNKAIEKSVQKDQIEKQLAYLKDELRNEILSIENNTTTINLNKKNLQLEIDRHNKLSNQISPLTIEDKKRLIKLNEEFQLYQQKTNFLNKDMATHKELESKEKEKQKERKKTLENRVLEIQKLNQENKNIRSIFSIEQKGLVDQFFMEAKLKLDLLNKLNKKIDLTKEVIFNFEKDLKQKESKFSEVNKNLDALNMKEKDELINFSISICHELNHQRDHCILCENVINENYLKTKLNHDNALLNSIKIEKMSLQKGLNTLESHLEKLKVNLNHQKQIQNDYLEEIKLIEKFLIDGNKAIGFDIEISCFSEKYLYKLEMFYLNFTKQISRLESNESTLEYLHEKQRSDECEIQESQKREVQYQNEIKNIQQEMEKAKDKLNLIKRDFPFSLELIPQLIELLDKLETSQNLINQLKLDSNFSQKQIQINIDNKLRIEKLLTENNLIIEELTQFIQKNSKFDNPLVELQELEQRKDKFNQEIQKLVHLSKNNEINLAENKSKKNYLSEQISSIELIIKSEIEKIKAESQKCYRYFLHQGQTEELKMNQIFKKLMVYDYGQMRDDLLDEAITLLRTQHESTLEKIKSYSQQLSKYQTIKDKLQRIESKVLVAKKELKVFFEELESWLNLTEVLGKDEFRNFVLSIVESLLIKQTNLELKGLCHGRYSIVQSSKTNRMYSDFVIEDHFLDHTQRKISTLSGGETFLVSLAMAMALAELTRGNTAIESLFIDEGFGSLDGESIEDVYQLLLDIQHSGKQIGIISHVENLTTKIPVNLLLHKNSDGTSYISTSLN